MHFLSHLWPFDGDESQKVKYLSISMALLIFSYTIFESLKDSIFLSFVGPIHQPKAKLLMLLMLPFITSIYSVIVGKSKRHHSVLFFIGSYATASLFFGLILTHPILGIQNTTTSPTRLLGWFFYAFFDIYPLTIMTTFWAMTSSISNPENATAQYGIMTAASRLAGMIAGALGHFLLKSSLSPNITIPILLICCFFSLSATAFCVYRLFTSIKQEYLLGYADRLGSNEKIKNVGILTGLKSIIRHPYAFGIFGLVCSYELIATMVNFQMQYMVATESGYNVKQIGSFMFGNTFYFQLLGFFIAILGTTKLPKIFGMRFGLLVTPILLLIFSAILYFNASLYSFAIMMIVMRALNYGFNTPVREMLFIPTSKTIQFRTKGWIESFGKTSSKISGSLYNHLISSYASIFTLQITTVAILTIGSIWVLIASAIGKTYQTAVSNNEVIGTEEAHL